MAGIHNLYSDMTFILLSEVSLQQVPKSDTLMVPMCGFITADVVNATIISPLHLHLGLFSSKLKAKKYCLY